MHGYDLPPFKPGQFFAALDEIQASVDPSLPPGDLRPSDLRQGDDAPPDCDEARTSASWEFVCLVTLVILFLLVLPLLNGLFPR